MKQITYYYVRHGQTVFNKTGIIQGQTDSPLDPEGIPALRETGSILHEIPFSRCFISPLHRCQETADIILEGRNIPAEVIEDLKEVSFGDIDGLPHAEHRKELKLIHFTNNLTLVHGESNASIRARARHAFDLMSALADDGDRILVVSHGTYYRHVLHELMHRNRVILKMDKRYHGAANGSVSVFVNRNGQYDLLCYPLTGDVLRQFLHDQTI
ncbi:MAG: histidine phosphatase family protein [Solobacterium sp.]|nr:histidine phosphatase family protein [Solobacterium sp.]